MIKKNGCKMRECMSSHRREIVGGVFLILATLLTILTLSGMGILGMFLTGLAMFCRKGMCCKNCNCGCCDVEKESSSELAAGKTAAAVKATKASK